MRMRSLCFSVLGVIALAWCPRPAHALGFGSWAIARMEVGAGWVATDGFDREYDHRIYPPLRQT